MHDPLSLLGDLIAEARKVGADAADAVFISGNSLSVSRRLGKTEQVEQSEGQDLSLRVFLGQRAAIVSSTIIDPTQFAALAERAVAMAKVVPEDPYAGLAETAAPPEAIDLDMVDSEGPTAADLADRAAMAEDAALGVAGITNSDGADAAYSRSALTLVTSAGFAGRRIGTSYSVSATAIAGSGTGMQRDYDYHSTVHLADLDDPTLVGRRAAERAVARLNPVRPKTANLPVVYEPRIAGSLLGHLSGAINGGAVARGTSFLKERMGERILAAGIAVHDDPRRVRGLRSRVFDAEGTPTRPRALVEDGVLKSWLLDSRTARQLGLHSTGHAARGIGGPPAPSASNLYLAAGKLPPVALMADIRLGLYVTELIGMGVNGVTGDYSRGAAGFMIRNGEIAEPVAEITIAGNLIAMFAALTPADDLVLRRGTDSPTVRIESMTVAGS